MISKELKIALIAAATVAVLGGAAIFGFSRHDDSTPSGNQAVSYEHQNIITTVFWAGEPADSDNGDISNTVSAWDENWQAHYGGVDDPLHRSAYRPAGFTPKENPFYVALPYNDIDADSHRKASADNCRRLQPAPDARYSYCKNIWVAITKSNKTVYAQWEDAGPFGEDDASYVFGSAAPANKTDERAGLDVSPAVRDALALQDVDRTSWRFVKASEVPGGPWKDTVTVSHGSSL